MGVRSLKKVYTKKESIRNVLKIAVAVAEQTPKISAAVAAHNSKISAAVVAHTSKGSAVVATHKKFFLQCFWLQKKLSAVIVAETLFPVVLSTSLIKQYAMGSYTLCFSFAENL